LLVQKPCPTFAAKRSETEGETNDFATKYAKAKQTSETMGMQTETLCEMTTVQLAQITGRTPDLFRMKWAKLKREGSPLFASDFDRNATLTVDQIIALRPELSGVKNISEVPSVVPMRPKAARPNEVAPQAGVSDVESVGRDWVSIGALGLVFVIATVVSGANTLKVSGQLSNSWLISNALMLMVSFTPILFIVARMEKFGVIVAVCVVVFEGFCNTAATYLSLMGGMVYVWGAPRGDCSAFLQNVVELTSSGHKQTAVGISICLALLVSSVQLVAFWGLKKRF
jgi:hypothetical protein